MIEAKKGFEKQVDVYEKARPSYPSAAIDFIFKTLNLTTNSEVIDLGSGTGKLTRQLEKYNLKLTAVEPVKEMREKFSKVSPNILVVDGTSTKIPMLDKSLDVVFCAQSFHWFSNEESLKEIYRVLKPSGALVLIWNQVDKNLEWATKMRLLTYKHLNGAPQYNYGKWRNVFNETNYFGKLNEANFKNYDENENIFVDKQYIWERMLSASYVSILEKYEQEKLKEEIFDFLSKENLDFKNGLSGTILKYVTDVFWTFPNLSK